MNHSQPATTEDEWLNKLKDSSQTFIRTMADWESLMNSGENPLKNASHHALKEFTESLRFEDDGLAHADYSSLTEEFGDQELDKLWACFGLSGALLKDYKNHWCEGRATCAPKTSRICTANCRG